MEEERGIAIWQGWRWMSEVLGVERGEDGGQSGGTSAGDVGLGWWGRH